MLAFTTSHNAGRFGVASYTLETLLLMRDSLAAGLAPGQFIKVRKDLTADMGEGAKHLAGLIRANVNDKGAMLKVAGEAPQVLLDRLEILHGTEGQCLIDGRTRALAIVLNFAITGKWIDYPTIEIDCDDQEAERQSLEDNNLLRTKSDWKARTAGFIAAINAGFISSESEGMKRYKLQRGSAQHAWSSAMAIKIHRLDLAKCASGLTAADWRIVKECKTQQDAEKIAYDKAGLVEKFNAPAACRAALLRAGMHSGNPLYQLIVAIGQGEAAAFDAAINASLIPSPAAGWRFP